MTNSWWDDALCAQTDPDAFTPDPGGNASAAKRICAECPVRTQCLQYALDNDVRGGIWGGHTDRQRRAMRRAAA